MQDAMRNTICSSDAKSKWGTQELRGSGYDIVNKAIGNNIKRRTWGRFVKCSIEKKWELPGKNKIKCPLQFTSGWPEFSSVQTGVKFGQSQHWLLLFLRWGPSQSVPQVDVGLPVLLQSWGQRHATYFVLPLPVQHQKDQAQVLHDSTTSGLGNQGNL